MFDFRIIEAADGNQIIDRRLKTPHNSLTPLQMLEYMEIDSTLALMDKMERKANRHKRKIIHSLLYRIAGLCRLV